MKHGWLKGGCIVSDRAVTEHQSWLLPYLWHHRAINNHLTEHSAAATGAASTAGIDPGVSTNRLTMAMLRHYRRQIKWFAAGRYSATSLILIPLLN